MKHSHAISVVPEAPENTIKAARSAEASGFDLLYVGDVQSTHRELWSTLTLIATVTTSIQIGPGVTNPITRHPAVTAGALATVDEISHGRAFLGLGSGDSAVRNLNLKAGTLGLTEEYARAVRCALVEGKGEWETGEFVARRWDRHIPTLFSAHGPKALRMAGRVADGVISGVGLTPEAVEYAREHVAIGAAEANRDVEDIKIWYMCYPSLAETTHEAIHGVAATLAAGGNLLARSPAVESVPDRYRSAMNELANQYNYTAHVKAAEGSPNSELVGRLGLTEYLASRFALAGTSDDVRVFMRKNDTHGIDRYWHIYSRPDLDQFVSEWGAELIDWQL